MPYSITRRDAITCLGEPHPSNCYKQPYLRGQHWQRTRIRMQFLRCSAASQGSSAGATWQDVHLDTMGNPKWAMTVTRWMIIEEELPNTMKGLCRKYHIGKASISRTTDMKNLVILWKCSRTWKSLENQRFWQQNDKKILQFLENSRKPLVKTTYSRTCH